VSDARVNVKLEGAEPSQAQVRTDGAGLARLKVRPIDATVRVGLDVVADGIGAGTLAARLEVVQGAIVVSRRSDTLLVESSGAATLAHLGFFNESRRFLGLRVPLAPAADGRLIAELPWPAGLEAQPLWVVASSQPDLGSPSAVGWPIAGAGGPAPLTFDARELLLLDGAPLAQRREDKRAQRVRLVIVGYATLALLLTLWLFVRRVRAAETQIGEHLARAGIDEAAPSIAPSSGGRTLLAIACIGLGFLVLALLALFKE
jgi:hypothetical protein